jgi:membrane-associated phospholipid phosphatase/DNA-directed RNA polymerase subunit RPC12/RpoP
MDNPYLLTAITSPIFIIMVIIGYYIFVPAEFRINYKHISKSRLLLGILPYGVSAYFIYVLVNSQALIRDILGLNPLLNYAKYIMMIEGDAVSYFQSFVSPTLTYILSFVYLMIFAFVMIFTFLLFVFSGNLKALQEYTIAFIIIYLVAFPFYIFFPVRVTGYTLSNISPLLYSLSPIIEQSLRFCDPNLDNCFPSLHAALTIMALLVVILRTDIKSYKIFAWIATVSILFSILYLGIHWITDLIGGVLLAIVAYFIAAKYRSRILAISRNVVVTIERKFGIYESIVCTNCSNELRIYPHLGEFECPHCNSVMHFHPLTHAYKQRKSI